MQVGHLVDTGANHLHNKGLHTISIDARVEPEQECIHPCRFLVVGFMATVYKSRFLLEKMQQDVQHILGRKIFRVDRGQRFSDI